ncbi:MAG: type II toxin-antitoxin system VapC family toxin, partial [Candidatus Dormiibacterota bacterium]
MSDRFAYLDTSAFVKLVISEPESSSLEQFLERWPRRASSSLLRTEAVRALRRAGRGDRVGAARRLYRRLWLARIDEPLLEAAGSLGSDALRTLDAIHLATAVAIGPDLGVLVTYDERLAAA